MVGSLVILGSIPAMAAAHGHGHGVGHQSRSSQSITAPSTSPSQSISASGQASTSVSGSPTPSKSHGNHGRGNGHAHNNRGQQVKAEVQTIHTLRAKVQADRQQYVQAVQAYVKALSSAMANGQSASLTTAVNQLKTINTTLAQAVKTEMAANQAASADANGAGGPPGLARVEAKFTAEETALTQATSQVEALTTQLSSGTTPSSSSSPSPSPSTSGTPSTSVSSTPPSTSPSGS